MRNALTCLMSTAAVVTAAPALAQHAPPPAAAAAVDSGDIVVTARRREENIQTVPVAVTAMSGETLHKLAAVNVQDMTRLAPSVSIGASSRGGGVPFMSIRGISSSDITGGIDPSIGIYMNDVIQNRPNGVLSALYDIQSVQVLRGPQGTLFGRNTVGGAILVNSRGPTKELEGYARATYGNYNYFKGEGAINVPFNDAIQLRVAGRIDRRDGYVRSITTGQDQSDLHNEGVRATLKIEPTPGFTNTTVFSYYHQDSHGVGATTPGLYPANAVVPGTAINSTTRNVSDAGNRALIAAAGLQRLANPLTNTTNEFQFDRVKTYDVTNTTVFKTGDHITLKNIFGWRQAESNNWFDADGSAARQLTVGSLNKFRQVSEELQLLGDFGRFSFVSGLYYFHEYGTDYSLSFTGVPAASIDSPASESKTGGDVDNKAYSAYVNASYGLTDRLKLSAGVRYTIDKRYVNLHSQPITNPLSATPGLGKCTVAPATVIPDWQGTGIPNYVTQTVANCSLEGRAEYKKPTWSVDLSWQATDDVLLYAAHRHGYHSGAFNVRATGPAILGPASPEYLDDVEVGLKSKFVAGGMPMQLNTALYYGWYKDIQRTQSLPAAYIDGNLRALAGIGNAAKAHIAGIEIEYNVEPVRGFNLRSFFAYNETKYDQFLDASVTPALDRKNDLFGFAPKYMWGATARYEYDLGSNGTTGAFQLNYFHSASFNDQLGNQPVYTILPAYDLVNARMEFNSMFGTGIDLALYMNNVFDKRYWTGGTAVASVGAATQVVGEPRMYGLELSYKFGR